MFKRIVWIVVIVFAIATPVYAHLTGAFVDFLAIVYDETTISELKQEMEQTKQEIEALTPQVDAAEKTFNENQTIAIEQLQFYSELGLDTWLALMQDGSDIVDLMGNQWVLESKIDNYLVELNDLYMEYQQLLVSKQTLEGHEQLLKAIEKSLQARQKYLNDNAGLELENIANYLDIDWTSEVEDAIITDLQSDADTIQLHLKDWISTSFTNQLTLNEQWLNERSHATYYFRKDHVYIEYEVNAEHVILLGQVLQNTKGTAAQLQIEAGFYNGFFLPEELLKELPSFAISYEQLTEVTGILQPFVVQENGGLTVHSK